MVIFLGKEELGQNQQMPVRALRRYIGDWVTNPERRKGLTIDQIIEDLNVIQKARSEFDFTLSEALEVAGKITRMSEDYLLLEMVLKRLGK